MSHHPDWSVTSLALAIAYKEAGYLEKAGLECERILTEVSDQESQDSNISARMIYGEYLLSPDHRSPQTIAKAFAIYQELDLMVHTEYEPLQKLAVQVGLATCWAFGTPRYPQREDIAPIGETILEAFEQEWFLTLSSDEREVLLKQWESKIIDFVQQFSLLIPELCFKICEGIRSRQLLLDLGYSLHLEWKPSSAKLVAQELELAHRLHELQAELSSLHRDANRLNADFASPDRVAWIEKDLAAAARQLDMVRREIAKFDAEGTEIRSGQTVSYSDMKKVLAC